MKQSTSFFNDISESLQGLTGSFREFRRNNPVRRILQYTVVALAMVFFILMMNRILFPSFRQLWEKDLTIEITATGEQHHQAQYPHVRLNSLICNGKQRDLSKITTDGIWKYSPEHDLLYIYESQIPNALTFSLEDAVSVDMTFSTKGGDGILLVTINGKQIKSLELHGSDQWTEYDLRYDTSTMVHPETHPGVMAAIFLFTLFLQLLLWKQIPDPAQTWLHESARAILLQAALALFLTAGCAMIQYQTPDGLLDYLDQDYLVILEHYILVFLLLHLVYHISCSHWISFSITGFVLELLNVISIVKLNVRGTPLLPWDFQMAGAALSVAGSYDLSFSPLYIVVLICTLLIAVCLYISRSVDRYPWKRALAGGAAALALLILFLNTTVFCGIWGATGNRVYRVTNYYKEKGFLVAFCEYINYLNPQNPPADYSKQTMNDLAADIMADCNPDASSGKIQSPNIIVIMSESFWDVTALERVEFAEDPLRVYRSLTEESMYGNLLSHVFGGNTVISEFEFLTGFHAAFFPSDYMVYGSCLGNDFSSAAEVLAAQGYETIAVHPYEATNYNRKAAYQILGFQNMIFEDDFPADAKRLRKYISDEAMYLEIKEQYTQLRQTSDAPLFLFGITMQNHGGYWSDTLNQATQVAFQSSGYPDSTVGSMADYFAGLRASDEALGMLIDLFRDVEEDTIIIYFGDHMSDAGTKTEKMMAQQSWYRADSFSSDVRSHTVPYLVWSNCGIKTGQQEIMDISMLLPTVLAQTDVQMPYFWHYLLELQDVCGAFNSSVAVSADLSTRKRSELTRPEQAYLEAYELLTYDYVWGSRYAEALWELAE